MSSTRRPPAGFYRGGLSGFAADPTTGVVGAAGLHLHEDWMFSTSGGPTRFGELGWVKSNVGGAGGSVALGTPSAATEAGVVELTTSAQQNRGGTLNAGGIVQLYLPAVGMVWACKVDMDDTSSVEVWAGFSGSTNGRVRVNDATQFLGVRYLATEGAWQGVCKNGSTAANETTVTIGAHVAGTFQVLGFEAVTSAGALGIQFMTFDCADLHQVYRTKVGPVISTNIPVTTGALALGCVSTGGGARVARQDFWTLGGRIAR